MQRKSFDASVADLTQSIGLLIRRLRAATASHELSLTESTVLARLEQHGPMTTAELARIESMKPQSMGATVAALEERELLQRTPHPTDGRQLLISLTAKGGETRRALKAAKRSWIASAISQLPKEEQETLFAAAEIIRHLAEQ
ncbi:MarR family winged helix-turn-helix transcriptional regulator [Silvibacterium dinghuense]|uniref:MarR family transcriptional regulator n=1 Tax=Silvibacterium dinghuense TaxID=1560006 RepID=A0A4Q1SHR9_9BACT|nr:MarR family transcriptional regulator [Silvibacterium dinghuense]RXS96893.1 MarR family transcriptional regulator [Silvibacterium dinghuense]GGG94481.1 MarR family transcriptional regulator [Silvibacterium dinghuense]